MSGPVLVPENVASYVATGDGGNGALLNARVYQLDPCLVVEDGDGTRFVPVFPAGMLEVDGDEVSFDGVRLTDGAEVSLAGGTVPTAPPDARIPDGCEGHLWLVNDI